MVVLRRQKKIAFKVIFHKLVTEGYIFRTAVPHTRALAL